jgi:hypothetical protein
MTRYENGLIPKGVLTTIASGYDAYGYWEHQGSAHIIYIWRATQAYALKKWGIKPLIRSGWNIYRPFAVQKAARDRACAAGNCNAAAYEGYSSHGGTWYSRQYTNSQWADALAIDVNPNGLSWAQVWEAARANGFLCGAITPAIAGIDEPWHIIDLNPWGAIPGGGGDEPFPEKETQETMFILKSGATYSLADAGWVYKIANATELTEALKIVAANRDGAVLEGTPEEYNLRKKILLSGETASSAPAPAEIADAVWRVNLQLKNPDATNIEGRSAQAGSMLGNVTADAQWLQENPAKATLDQAQIDQIVAGVVAGIPAGSDPVAVAAAVVAALKNVKYVTVAGS